MRRIAIINQKGGVGKTTTSVNLSAALSDQGRCVQVIDMDPQAHATLHLGVEIPRQGPSIYNVLTGNAGLADVRKSVAENLFVLGAHIDLAAAEVELAGTVGREIILRDLLDAEAHETDGQFDYTIMDCPPSLGVLTLNALTTATEVIIPLQPHFLALHGLSKLLETIALVWRRVNPKLKVSGIVLCMVDHNTRLAAEVVEDLGRYLESARGRNVPWSHCELLAARIRRNIRLAECPSFGQSIFQYSPDSNGAADYRALAKQIDAASSTPAATPAPAAA